MAEWAGLGVAGLGVDRLGVAGLGVDRPSVFVSVSLNLQDVSLAVPDRSFGFAGPERAILLSDSPALICEGGVVVQANLAVARLAGRRLPESLIGLSLHCLLAQRDTGAELIGPDGRATPVRVARWSSPGTGQVVILLVDASDESCRRAVHAAS